MVFFSRCGWERSENDTCHPFFCFDDPRTFTCEINQVVTKVRENLQREYFHGKKSYISADTYFSPGYSTFSSLAYNKLIPLLIVSFDLRFGFFRVQFFLLFANRSTPVDFLMKFREKNTRALFGYKLRTFLIRKPFLYYKLVR